MKAFEIIRLLIFSMPLGIFITFGLFLVITIQMKVRKIDVILRRLVTVYCLSAAVASLFLLFYYYFPDLFSRFGIVYFISVIYAMILFYHFLCFAIKSYEQIRPFHYIIPLVLCIGMLICKVSFPVFWAREGNSVLFIGMLVFGIIYSVLPLYKMHNYDLKLVLVSNTTGTLNRKVAVPFIFEVILFPIAFVLMPLITKQNPGISLSVLMMLFILLALRMNIPLTYAMIRHYAFPLNEAPLFAPFVSESDMAPKVKTQKQEIIPLDSGKDTKRIYHKYTRKNRVNGQLIEIDKKVFEAYFRKYKPYLDPGLKIQDLIIPLQSNRTYISKFVNHTYKMSFSSYVNNCRLHEMERLLQLPGNKNKTAREFIRQAGFGDYRHYLRVKERFR